MSNTFTCKYCKKLVKINRAGDVYHSCSGSRLLLRKIDMEYASKIKGLQEFREYRDTSINKNRSFFHPLKATIRGVI